MSKNITTLSSSESAKIRESLAHWSHLCAGLEHTENWSSLNDQEKLDLIIRVYLLGDSVKCSADIAA